MNYEKVLEKPFLNEDPTFVRASEKEDILGLIRYFQEKGYSHDKAHRIMKLADIIMRCAAGMEKV